MQRKFWQERWLEGRTGFHQPSVNRCLARFWPDLEPGTTVLVPWHLPQSAFAKGMRFTAI